MGKGKQFGGGADPADTILPEDREGFDNGAGVSAVELTPEIGLGEAALGRD
jgi:hypothetical protein